VQLPQFAITVRQPYAGLIADGHKTLELRRTVLMQPGQRYVIASGSESSTDLDACQRLALDPQSLSFGVTLCLVECMDVRRITDGNLPRILRGACCDEQTFRKFDFRFAHILKVVELTKQRRVRGNFGVWVLRKSRHCRDAGLL
jgi:hypothetical protein